MPKQAAGSDWHGDWPFYKKLDHDQEIKIGRIPPLFAEEEPENE